LQSVFPEARQEAKLSLLLVWETNSMPERCRFDKLLIQ